MKLIMQISTKRNTTFSSLNVAILEIKKNISIIKKKTGYHGENPVPVLCHNPRRPISSISTLKRIINKEIELI